MDRPHQPHVIRTWTVERTRHPVRDVAAGVIPGKNRKPYFQPENRPPKGPAKKSP